MNKKLDKKITQSKPNLKVSKTFTDDVMKQVMHIDPPKERRFKLLQGFRPAFVMAALVLVVGAVALTSGNKSDLQQNSNESEEIAATDQETIGFASESQQPAVVESENENEESSPSQPSQITDEQLVAPTTIAEAKVEMEEIVIDIESDVVAFDEDLDFADDLLSDDTLSLEL